LGGTKEDVMDGNWGTALMVDLGTKEVSHRELPEQWFKEYIGGEGVAMRLFAELVDFDDPPLEPSQPLIAAAGPLSGTTAPSSGRTCFVFRSPASARSAHPTWVVICHRRSSGPATT